MNNVPYQPHQPHDYKIDPDALRRFAIQQISAVVGQADTRKLRIIVRGNNFNNLRMWVEGPDHILARLPSGAF